MPRPKRTKVAPSAPVSRAAKQAALQIPAKANDPIEDDGDHVKGIAPTSARRGRRRDMSRPELLVDQAIAMNAEHSKAFDNLRRQQHIASPPAEDLAPAAVESDIESFNDFSDAPISPEVEMGRRSAPVESSVLGNYRRRSRQPSILGRPTSRARSSSIESNLADGNGLNSRRARENSVLGFGGGRRKQRQASILGRGRARVRSSSIGLEMEVNTPAHGTSILRAGTFRRRNRQPSILGTAQKQRRNESDEEDFDPEDESTPLHLSKAVASSHATSSATNPRKRKFSPLEAARSTPDHQSNDDIDSDEDLPRVLSPSINPRTPTPEPYSETMAPPRSSSSSARRSSPPPTRVSQTAQSMTATRRQPVRHPRNDDLPSSPPSLTHSPNRPARHARATPKAKPAPSTMSTAQLQSLLPRRRIRPTQNVFDIGSSDDEEIDVTGLASDDDELTHLTVGTSRTTRRTPAAARRVTKLKSAAKGKEPGRKTYGSRPGVSDKENEQGSDADVAEDAHDPDDSLGPLADESPENSQELEERVGKELKQAKRKFEVVDKWELEFEEVTASSSPWDDGR